ncbi:MAG TPA: phage tail tube protein [Candidatus Cybelea sp.]|nr:phage tail tube protein [Candidatus Cybelea sp.]
MSNALLGYGAVVEVATGTSPDVLQALDELHNIKPPQMKLDQVDVTHMQSPNRTREFITGLRDMGEFSCEGNYVPGSPTDDLLFALMNLPPGTSRHRAIRLSFVSGTTWFFSGELSAYEIAVPFDDKMTFTATFKVSGDLTVGST